MSPRREPRIVEWSLMGTTYLIEQSALDYVMRVSMRSKTSSDPDATRRFMSTLVRKMQASGDDRVFVKPTIAWAEGN